MKWDVIYKFCLLCMLIAGLAGILFSGLGIYFQWSIQGIFQWHLGSALLFIFGVEMCIRDSPARFALPNHKRLNLHINHAISFLVPDNAQTKAQKKEYE